MRRRGGPPLGAYLVSPGGLERGVALHCHVTVGGARPKFTLTKHTC